MIEIYEHFDLEPEHIGDKALYNETLEKWVPCNDQLWEALRLLAEIKFGVIWYRETIHNGENLETAKVYIQLLENWARAKKHIQPFANEFCITYKGYSLN